MNLDNQLHTLIFFQNENIFFFLRPRLFLRHACATVLNLKPHNFNIQGSMACHLMHIVALAACSILILILI